jgi:hypothetical protein
MMSLFQNKVISSIIGNLRKHNKAYRIKKELLVKEKLERETLPSPEGLPF